MYGRARLSSNVGEMLAPFHSDEMMCRPVRAGRQRHKQRRKLDRASGGLVIASRAN
jgi:hypothetical protein